MALYADAFRRYRDLGIEVDAAFTTIEMASLLDPALPEVVAAGTAAREILVRLGARPFLARLDAALARSVGSAGAAGAGAAGAGSGSEAPARKGARSSSVKAG